MKRSEIRERTFIILFQRDFNYEFTQDIDYYLQREGLKDADAVYAKKTILGTVERLEEIDKLISKYLVNWSFDRLSKTDISVLRLAIYEMLYSQDVPDKVAINEAIELAKKYNGDVAGVFVNGLLDNIYKNEIKHK
ncbi:MAG: transcription antitermination factor NusB [Eubacteriaceae bacterium]|nr:transcription antitermination factor NusB [Eubacteriaceae bacterium]